MPSHATRSRPMDHGGEAESLVNELTAKLNDVGRPVIPARASRPPLTLGPSATRVKGRGPDDGPPAATRSPSAASALELVGFVARAEPRRARDVADLRHRAPRHRRPLRGARRRVAAREGPPARELGAAVCVPARIAPQRVVARRAARAPAQVRHLACVHPVSPSDLLFS